MFSPQVLVCLRGWGKTVYIFTLTITPLTFSEVVDVEAVLKRYNIDETVIFYGFEEIVSNNMFWRIFALIKKLSPSFVRFYKLPAEKVNGVMVRVKM